VLRLGLRLGLELGFFISQTKLSPSANSNSNPNPNPRLKSEEHSSKRAKDLFLQNSGDVLKDFDRWVRVRVRVSGYRLVRVRDRLKSEERSSERAIGMFH
jgi:hypothetical protein